MRKKTNVFRFHTPPVIPEDNATRRLVKRKFRSEFNYSLISADTVMITDYRGVWPIESYLDFPQASYITLTRREADLIALANPGKRPPRALEEIHPWLPPVKYYESSRKNFRNLEAIIKKFRQHLVIPASFCDEKWNKVCNSIRMTSNSDIRFYSAWHLPLQDTYILEERREDRSVIALDVNAMYAHCMQRHFPDPARMHHVVYNRDVTPGEILPIGLFRCTLKGPSTDFIRKHNPFRTYFAGRYLASEISERVFIDLNEFEVAFYQRHFWKIHISDAVVSEKWISHPLARDAKRSFARRLHYLSHQNKPLADREKFLSTLLASCTHRPRRLRRAFETPDLAEEYLSKRFGIILGKDGPDRFAETRLRGQKGITASTTGGNVFCEVPNLFDGSASFVFGQRIVAQSRIKLLELMEKVSLVAPNSEICYVNIDAIHFSLPSKCVNSALKILRSSISDRMGGLKIEVITRHGLWLEPGRYWLYSDKVCKFSNRSISHRGNCFKDHSIHVVNRSIDDLSFPIRKTVTMNRSMSDIFSLVDDPVCGLTRQQIVAIDDHTPVADILSALERNRMQCIPRRMQAFKKLAAQMENCQVSLPRDLAEWPD